MNHEVINNVLLIDQALIAGIARGRAIAFQVGLPEFGKSYRTDRDGRVTVTDVTKARTVMLDAAYRAETSKRRLAQIELPSQCHQPEQRDKARAVFEHGVIEGIHEAIGESVGDRYTLATLDRVPLARSRLQVTAGAH
jgi:hypothetical protein